jgi:hypothetical protein
VQIEEAGMMQIDDLALEEQWGQINFIQTEPTTPTPLADLRGEDNLCCCRTRWSLVLKEHTIEQTTHGTFYAPAQRLDTSLHEWKTTHWAQNGLGMDPPCHLQSTAAPHHAGASTATDSAQDGPMSNIPKLNSYSSSSR